MLHLWPGWEFSPKSLKREFLKLYFFNRKKRILRCSPENSQLQIRDWHSNFTNIADSARILVYKNQVTHLKGYSPGEGYGYLRQVQSSCIGGSRAPRAFLENRQFENLATHMLRNLIVKTGTFFQIRLHFDLTPHIKISKAPILTTRVSAEPYTMSYGY